MDINNLLIKYFGGKASKEELTQLDLWKSEASSNLEKMKEAKALWEASGDMKDWDAFDVDTAWKNVSFSIDASEEEIIEEINMDKEVRENKT